MRHLRQLTGVFAFLLVLLGGRTALADNICGETVPSNRIVDGIPAYSQCDASTTSDIYSNNGVDTATASGGTGWVRTQGGKMGYQCTELAHRYLYFKWNVQSVPSGNAGVWCDGTIPSGLVKTTTPVHGDVIVFAPGSCGASATTGHVAVVDVVNANSTVTFVEQNNAGRRSCAISTAACFLHVTANDGASVDGGAPDAAAPDTGPPADDASPRSDLAADRRRVDVSATGGAAGSGGVIGTGGADGTGGVAGTGGMVATTSSGGQVGSGGVVGSGGAVGSGGTSNTGGATATTVASAGGSGGTTSATTTEPSTSSNNGCACRLADRGSPAHGCLALLAVLALGALVRRRRLR